MRVGGGEFAQLIGHILGWIAGAPRRKAALTHLVAWSVACLSKLWPADDHMGGFVRLSWLYGCILV